MHDKLAAAVQAVAADFYLAVVHLDQTMDQCEPQPKTAFGPGEGAVDLIK